MIEHPGDNASIAALSSCVVTSVTDLLRTLTRKDARLRRQIGFRDLSDVKVHWGPCYDSESSVTRCLIPPRFALVLNDCVCGAVGLVERQSTTSRKLLAPYKAIKGWAPVNQWRGLPPKV